MGACIWKRVMYDMSCKCFPFFVNVEALLVNDDVHTKIWSYSVNSFSRY